MWSAAAVGGRRVIYVTGGVVYTAISVATVRATAAAAMVTSAAPTVRRIQMRTEKMACVGQGHMYAYKLTCTGRVSVRYRM